MIKITRKTEENDLEKNPYINFFIDVCFCFFRLIYQGWISEDNEVCRTSWCPHHTRVEEAIHTVWGKSVGNEVSGNINTCRSVNDALTGMYIHVPCVKNSIGY